MVKASIELGVKADPSFRLEDWHAIASAMDKKGNFIVPKATLGLIAKNKSPHRIEVKDGHVLPDGRPFLLHHGDRHLYVLGFEIDRATEPLTTTQERRNIAEKFRHYKELFDRRLFKSHYGFDNSIVMWVTTNESRMNSMMRLWHDEYGSCSYMTFTTWKDWFYEPRFPKTDLETMFTRGNLRVGKPPLHLNKFWES